MINFAEVKECALEHLEDVTAWLGLDGEQRGREFVAYNPRRRDDNLGSFTINCETGVWADFADDDAKGGDVVSYVAYIKGVGQAAAARELLSFLDSLGNNETPPPAGGGATGLTAPVNNAGLPLQDVLISPIPADATIPTFIPGFGRPSVVYAYRNGLGQILFYVLRADPLTAPKVIRPLTLWTTATGQRRWRLESMPAPRPLYNLDLITQRPEAPILIVEGEKAADAARPLFPEGVVTTTPNGAQAVKHADLSPLQGRTIIIWPDNDGPGEKYADHIKDALVRLGHRGSLTIIRPGAWDALYDDTGAAMIRKRTAPAEVGWDAADAVDEGWAAAHVRLVLAQAAPRPVQIPPSVPGPVSPSYSIGQYDISDKGVAFTFPATDRRPERTVFVSSRLDVTALTRDEGGRNWGLLLQFPDGDGHVKEWAMPQEMLAGEGRDFRSVLNNMGVSLNTTSEARGLLTHYLSIARPEARALCTTTVGWHDNVFVLPNRTFGQADERVILQSQNPHDVAAFETRGTLAEWNTAVGHLCVGNSRLVLAVCTALAGPLLNPLGEENGGFHLRGASSVGKTKALKVAGSVWGSAALIKTWRATSSGLEGVAVQRNDTVLLLDELSQCGGDEAGATVYMLANGEGRTRATTSGAARQTSRWRFLFLSTGEVDLAQHISADGRQIRAGQEVRFLDIPADAGQGMGLFETLHGSPTAAAFALGLDEAVGQHYGALGPALLEHLTINQGLECFRDTVLACQEHFVRHAVPSGADGQVGRAARRFGLLAGVGEAAIEAHLLAWEPGEAYHSVRRCFDAWLAERGGSEAMEDLRAIEQVKGILERDGGSRFDPLPGTGDVHEEGREDVRNRLGFKKRNAEGLWEYWVLPKMYKDELCRGFDPKVVTRALRERGYLKIGRDGKPQITETLPRIGAKRVYVILPTVWGDKEAPG
jgi:uncharacterized protein (DUF927 family)